MTSSKVSSALVAEKDAETPPCLLRVLVHPPPQIVAESSVIALPSVVIHAALDLLSGEWYALRQLEINTHHG